jgi:transposase
MKMRNSEKFNDKQKKQIKHWKKKTKDKNLYRKLEVLDYASKGFTNKKISELTDFSVSRISDFVSEYIQNGIGYFTEEHRKGGNHRNLSNEQEQSIIRKFEEQAKMGKVVNLSLIKAEYEKVRGKETANSTFYSFLERMEWRRVMPRGQHPKKAGDEDIEASKKLTFNSKK